MSIRHAAQMLKEELWEEFGLNDRAILFHLIDHPYGPIRFGSGLITDADDLYDSDAMNELFEQYDVKEFEVYGVDTLMLGDGEVDHAGWDEIDYLNTLIDESPNALNAMFDEYADHPASIGECVLENPWAD